VTFLKVALQDWKVMETPTTIIVETPTVIQPEIFRPSVENYPIVLPETPRTIPGTFFESYTTDHCLYFPMDYLDGIARYVHGTSLTFSPEFFTPWRSG